LSTTNKLKVLSLGAGVQSTTLALMAAAGELGEMPDCAIFADTGWEPKAVYEHLERLKAALPFPVYMVTRGNIRDDLVREMGMVEKRHAYVPWHLVKPNGQRGIGKRECTAQYKLAPIRRKIVELLGGKRPKGGAEVWVGISMDEIIRMKPSKVQYIVNRWPLIEKRMSRTDCVRWMEKQGWAAPKSACIGCPFHSRDQWMGLSKEELADAIEMDEMIRDQFPNKGKQYVHSSCKPLKDIDLRSDAEIGQFDLFMNDCEGMCGV